VLKTKAVNAKIDQMQKKVVVLRTTHRTFSKQHWQQVRTRLAEVDANLAIVEQQLATLPSIKQQAQQMMTQQTTTNTSQ
jgi:hypothetical protein